MEENDTSQKPTSKSGGTLKKNVILNTAFRFLMVIAPFLTAPYVSRVLMSDGVGIFGYTQSLVSYFTMFAALGTVAYGTREIAKKRENKEEYSKAFWEIELISVICTVACMAAWIVLALLYVDYKIYLLIFSFSILSATMDISWFYAGLEKYKYTVFINGLFKILSVVGIFVFVKSPGDLWIYVLIYSASLFLGNASMWFFLPKFLVKTKIDKRSLGHHFKETLVYFIPTIATSLYTVLDKTLIGSLIQGETTVIIDGTEVVKKTSEIESGYYEQATKIIDLVKLVAFAGIQTVIYSRASYLYAKNEQESVKRLTLNALDFVMVLSIGAMFGLIAIANSFVPVFFGAGYEKSGLLLQIMAPLVPIIAISGTLGSAYYSPVGKRKQSSLFLIVGALVNLAISAPLVIYFQSVGAAVASVIAETVIAVLYFCFCKKAVTLKELFLAIWKKLVAGGIMFVALFFFAKYGKSFVSNDIAFLAIAIFGGAVIYGLGLLALRDSSLGLAFKFLRRK